MLQLINYHPAQFLKKGWKNLPLTFFIEHLLHRLYGVDAPASTSWPPLPFPSLPLNSAKRLGWGASSNFKVIQRHRPSCCKSNAHGIFNYFPLVTNSNFGRQAISRTVFEISTQLQLEKLVFTTLSLFDGLTPPLWSRIRYPLKFVDETQSGLYRKNQGWGYCVVKTEQS